MAETIGIVMPAFAAEATIAEGVNSVLAQTHADWQLLIIADDGKDYEKFLADRGIEDKRIRHMSSGKVRGGSTRARNMAFDALDTRYVALLDADDRFKPQKLERVMAALADHAIVSTALDVMSADYRSLRFVGAGPDRVLRAGEHKFTSLSMDTMVSWDRRKTDARYDPDLNNMTDLDLLLGLYKNVAASFHIGTPLHDYVKMPVSMSNGPGVTERMIAAKTTLLSRLASGFYPLADAGGVEGMTRFLTISLQAERDFDAAMAERPGLLFEDHLEPRLRAALSD